MRTADAGTRGVLTAPRPFDKFESGTGLCEKIRHNIHLSGFEPAIDHCQGRRAAVESAIFVPIITGRSTFRHGE
jgi:hypothetical protein